MKKYLPEDDPSTKGILQSLPKIYALVKYAWFAVYEGYYACTKIINNEPIPMVYYFTDHNGTYGEYILTPITEVTTGGVYCWSIHKEVIKRIADHENERLENEQKKG